MVKEVRELEKDKKRKKKIFQTEKMNEKFIQGGKK